MLDGDSESLLWLICLCLFDLTRSMLLTLHHRHSTLYTLNVNERCNIHSSNSSLCFKYRIMKIYSVLSRLIYVPCPNTCAYISIFNMVGIVDSSS